VNRRVVSQAVVIATGVTADGRREVLGFDVGDSEDGAFWTAFLRGLKARGLAGVQLVISDAHTGLKAAIASVLIGASWQRCRVHFMRNVLAVVPKGNAEMVAAAIRTIFAQPDAEHVHEQFEVIATMLGKQLPKVEQMLREARDDLLAFTGFPASHWKKTWSTNPLERLNKEVKRRTDVVGVFPNPPALLRLAGAVLVASGAVRAARRRPLWERLRWCLARPTAAPPRGRRREQHPTHVGLGRPIDAPPGEPRLGQRGLQQVLGQSLVVGEEVRRAQQRLRPRHDEGVELILVRHTITSPLRGGRLRDASLPRRVGHSERLPETHATLTRRTMRRARPAGPPGVPCVRNRGTRAPLRREARPSAARRRSSRSPNLARSGEVTPTVLIDGREVV
jgi:hypothetical protein